MYIRSIVPSLCLALALAISAAPSSAAPLEHRWVYLATNLLVDQNLDNALKLLDRAAKAGYNGVVLTDSKFMRWDNLPEKYAQNVRRVRKACRDRKLACIACVCPIGYSNDLLSRDPNLAEGLPVVDAPFMAKDGQLIPADDSIKLANGGFEQSNNNSPKGWAFVDAPGKITFIDTQTKFEGNCSLRMQDIGVHDPQHGHGRACQTLAVHPFRYYHVSVAVKTRDFESAGEVQIAVLGKDGAALNFYQPHVDKTQDWKRIDVTFNSLESSQVNLYLGIWGGRRGTIWWDDVRIEPAGLVNLVRRGGAPLRAKGPSGVVYEEGRDIAPISDPKLGMDPWAGAFSAWHEQPKVTLPKGSRIRPGQTVSLSYYHTVMIYSDQVMCCMAEPKLYDVLRWQIREVHKNIDPDGYFLSHDEIRVQGWDESCRRCRLAPGQILAENVKRCQAYIRKEDPEKPIYVWSDMFDPNHNAQKTGRYYLVKGDGPWHESWKGLDRGTLVVNWNSAPDKRVQSLKHFADLGHKQVLAGYYDGPIPAITAWLHDARPVQGVVGVMYTTWCSGYDNLEKFAAELSAAEK